MCNSGSQLILAASQISIVDFPWEVRESKRFHADAAHGIRTLAVLGEFPFLFIGCPPGHTGGCATSMAWMVPQIRKKNPSQGQKSRIAAPPPPSPLLRRLAGAQNSESPISTFGSSVSMGPRTATVLPCIH